MITFNDVKNDASIRTYIIKADESLRALGYTEHSFAHVTKVSETASYILKKLSYPEREIELTRIAAFLHDIGKVMPSTDLSHAMAGAQALARCGESDIVVNAVESHHGEAPAKSIYASILQMADSLSSTRPGARMEAADGYIRRIKTLETIAKEFDGVSNAYVIQAGRELRVIVSPEIVSDIQALDIAAKIRRKIEESTDSSIPIKIMLIRESRFTEIAKPTSIQNDKIRNP